MSNEKRTITQYIADKTQACANLQRLFSAGQDDDWGDVLTLDTMEFIRYLNDISDNAAKDADELIGIFWDKPDPHAFYEAVKKRVRRERAIHFAQQPPLSVQKLLEIDKKIYQRPTPEAHYSLTDGHPNYMSTSIMHYFSTIGKQVLLLSGYSDTYFARRKLDEALAVMRAYIDEHNPWDKKRRQSAPCEKTLEELLNELNGLTGLARVKEEVHSLVNLVKISEIRKQRGLGSADISLHMVFSGNPGTGKTTVARLLAGIYKQIGVLSKGHLVETDRAGLVAGYVGQTAKLTSEVIKSALGGILFIDEAYALTENKGETDFGREAVETLLKAMEDLRGDLIVIVAGYPDLMEKFLSSNPGLKSRFNRFIAFEDYTPEELFKIFVSLAEKNALRLSKGAKQCAQEYFQKWYENRDENYSNARGVRNYFELALRNQANRLAKKETISTRELITLSKDDLASIELL